MGGESDEDEELLRQHGAHRGSSSARLDAPAQAQVGFSRAGGSMDCWSKSGRWGCRRDRAPDVLMTFEEWQDEEAARKAADA